MTITEQLMCQFILWILFMPMQTHEQMNQNCFLQPSLEKQYSNKARFYYISATRKRGRRRGGGGHWPRLLPNDHFQEMVSLRKWERDGLQKGRCIKKYRKKGESYQSFHIWSLCLLITQLNTGTNNVAIGSLLFKYRGKNAFRVTWCVRGGGKCFNQYSDCTLIHKTKFMYNVQ